MHHGMLMSHGFDLWKIKNSRIFFIVLGNLYLQLPMAGHG